MENDKTISIVGGGITGLVTAIALQKAGIYAQVFESVNDIKPAGAGIVLANNALRVFERLGLKEEAIAKGKLLKGFNIYESNGKVITKGTIGNPTLNNLNLSIHRAELHDMLLNKLAEGQLQTGKKLIDIEIGNKEVALTFQDGNTQACNFLIAAEGIHSFVRQKILPKAHPRYNGYTCWRAVIDAGDIRVDGPSESWGTKGRFGIVPLANNRIYWFSCVNSPQNNSLTSKYRVADLLKIFGNFHDPVRQILSRTNDSDLIHNDIIDLKPLDKFAFGRVVLAGDAAHATSPNLGQGAAQGIEDAYFLAKCMHENKNYEYAIKSFEQKRLGRTRWITETSRKLGIMAQLENPVLVAIRNGIMRLTPASVNERQLRKVLDVKL